MRVISAFTAASLMMTFSSIAQPHSAPSTATFMNIITVCGAGLNIRIDADLEGSISSVYERETTRGRLVQEVTPEIVGMITSNSEIYRMYLECVRDIL